jgi:hypothetical protein
MRVVVFAIWRMEAHNALGDKECLVVHLMPMGWWACRVRWECEFCRTQAVVCDASIT